MFKPNQKTTIYLCFFLIGICIQLSSYAQCGGNNEPCELCDISAKITAIENATIVDGNSRISGNVQAGATKTGSPMKIEATGCGVITLQIEVDFNWGQGESIAWIHGISYDSSNGWSAAEGVNPGEGWIFVDSITGVCSSNTYGPGFFWDSEEDDSSSFNPDTGNCNGGISSLSYNEVNNDPSDNLSLIHI